MLEKTLESHLACKKIQPVHPKGDQSWVFTERTDVEGETPILWPPDEKSWLIWKDPDAKKDWGQEERRTTENEMVGWHRRLNGYEFGWTLGVGDGQEDLVCCSLWGHRVGHDWATEVNWTECDFSGVRLQYHSSCSYLWLWFCPTYNHILKKYQDAPSIMFIYPFCLNLFSDCPMSRKWIPNSLTLCGLSTYALTLPHIFCSTYFSPGLILSSLFTMLIPILHLVSTWFGLVTKSCPTLVTPWTIARQAPLSMDSPGKNTGVGCHFLLQGIFLTQESNLGLLHCRQILSGLSAYSSLKTQLQHHCSEKLFSS